MSSLNSFIVFFATSRTSLSLLIDSFQVFISFSVSGRVKIAGVKLARAGIPLSKLITDYCGGMQDGHTLKAFFPGGASGGILPAHLAHLPLDFGTFEKFGGFIGSHAIVILSDQDNIKEAALNTMRFFKH